MGFCVVIKIRVPFSILPLRLTGVGLASGYILALTDLVVEPMGPAGLQIGFIIGLTSAAIMMMLRMRFLQRLPSAINSCKPASR